MSETESKNSIDGEPPKAKPCCVCLPEKDMRDQCILFNGLESEKCKVFIEEYKKCMKTHGFDI